MKQIGIEILRPLLKHRKDDSHKGDYGHLLIVAGCTRMPGAASLAVGSSLKSGCGLVTLHSTQNACNAAVGSFPSAMLSCDPSCCFSVLPSNLDRYSAIAVGPGLGQDSKTVEAFSEFLKTACEKSKPMLIDADALNILAYNPELIDMIPSGSVLTPHPGELGRLLGQGYTEEDCKAFAAKTSSVLVAKGWHTRIYTPDRQVYENLSGNPGMAKAGSGDVLTGLVAGLMARGYEALHAAMLGVWLHGRTGDILTEKCTAEAYSSRDMIDWLYCAFVELYSI